MIDFASMSLHTPIHRNAPRSVTLTPEDVKTYRPVFREYIASHFDVGSSECYMLRHLCARLGISIHTRDLHQGISTHYKDGYRVMMDDLSLYLEDQSPLAPFVVLRHRGSHHVIMVPNEKKYIEEAMRYRAWSDDEPTETHEYLLPNFSYEPGVITDPTDTVDQQLDQWTSLFFSREHLDPSLRLEDYPMYGVRDVLRVMGSKLGEWMRVSEICEHDPSLSPSTVTAILGEVRQAFLALNGRLQRTNQPFDYEEKEDSHRLVNSRPSHT